jgi:hypothetical protein
LRRLAPACASQRVELLLGGRGPWPESLPAGATRAVHRDSRLDRAAVGRSPVIDSPAITPTAGTLPRGSSPLQGHGAGLSGSARSQS